MSDFKIIYPSVSYNATLGSTYSVNSDYPLSNTVKGSINKYAEFSSELLLSDITYTLNANDDVNYVFFQNLKRIRDYAKTDLTLAFRTNTTAGFSGASTENFTITANSFIGRRGEDFLTEASGVSKLWFALQTYSGAATCVHRYGKIILSKGFDFDRNPESLQVDEELRAGVGLLRKITARFSGITATKKAEFIEVFNRKNIMPIVISDLGNLFLMNEYSFLCEIADFSFSVNSRENYDLTIVFQEVL